MKQRSQGDRCRQAHFMPAWIAPIHPVSGPEMRSSWLADEERQTMRIPGGGGLQKQLMRQMEKLQRDMTAAQEELAALRVEATAGGGAVRAVANGQGELVELHISPEAADPSDLEMLQDLVLAAVREALEKGRRLQEERMGDITGGLGLPGL
jgi:hypothetical protein